MCPPAYYAHNAAVRARSWMERKDGARDDASIASGSSGGSGGPTWTWEFHDVHEDLRNSFYFI